MFTSMKLWGRRFSKNGTGTNIGSQTELYSRVADPGVYVGSGFSLNNRILLDVLCLRLTGSGFPL